MLPRTQVINSHNDSTTAEWLYEMRAMWSEGERSPAQVRRVVSHDFIAGVADSPFEQVESEKS